MIFNSGLSEVAEKFLKKGAKVYIEGALQTRKWTDNAGHDKYTTEVVLQPYNGVLTMLDAASGSRSNGAADPAHRGSGGGYEDSYERGHAASRANRARSPGDDFPDDDIPFVTCDPAAEPYLKRRLIA